MAAAASRWRTLRLNAPCALLLWGRENYLFAGSDVGEHATLYSLLGASKWRKPADKSQKVIRLAVSEFEINQSGEI
jgi:hypothetical protein